MSIPALPSNPTPTHSARPAAESRVAPETRPTPTAAVSETGDRGPLDQVQKPTEADQVKQAARKKELEEAVAQLNEKLKPFIQEAVRFHVDEDSGKLVVAVVDTEKNTVIRQIPSQEALKMSRELDPHHKQSGLLLNTQA